MTIQLASSALVPRGSADRYADKVVAYLTFDSPGAPWADTANNLWTPGTNVSRDTSTVKWGAGSAKFTGGAEAKLTTPYTPNLQMGAEDFTIELWINTTQTTSNATLIASAWDGVGYAGGWGIQLNGDASGPLTAYFANYSPSVPFLVANSNGIQRDGTWRHIAWTCKSQVHKLFLHGSLVALNTTVAALGSGPSILALGNDPVFFPATRGYVGYMDGVRLTKGVARYTENFDVSNLRY